MTDRFILTAAEMCDAEQAAIDAGSSVEALMERAGAAVAEAAWRFAGPLPTLILCGPGNNGGDGYVVARLLEARGVPVRVAAFGSPKAGAAAAARARWDGPVEPLNSVKGAPLLIDALFGTGLTRALEPSAETALGRLAAEARATIAVDLPSGVETDSGALLGQVPRFDLTVALGALKPAHRLQPAAGVCGRVAVADIGISAESETVDLVAPALTAPRADDHKYSRGMVAVVGGATPGASRLAASAALRAGAGYVLLIDPEAGGGGPDAIVRSTDAALDDERIGALLIGPGLGRDDRARRRLDAALASGRPLILDGDALHLIAPSRLPPGTILTPHSGEFAALFRTSEGSKLDRARAAAGQSSAVIIFKGADTLIAAPDGRAAIAPPAPAWLATAGTGDVLAGIVAAMRARGMAPFEAAKAGVWLHAEAARRAGPALIADDLADHLPAAIAACL